MVDMGVGDKCTLLKTSFDIVLQNFDNPVSFNFGHMHVMSCNDGCESPHQPINGQQTQNPFVSKENHHFNAP
jgi:hypothetical protein